ncbi:MAG: hypothetical protein Q4G69_00175 [Planctomycetia bacterium]|nr:hypothetical protein [Planctomycetia bacterium]
MGKKICLEIGMKTDTKGKNKKSSSPDPKESSEKKGSSMPMARIIFLIFILIFLFLFFKYRGNNKISLFPIKKRSENFAENTISHPFSLLPQNIGQENDPVPKNLQVLRIATWNLFPLDFAKINDPDCGSGIASVIAEFDLIALQGILSRNSSVLDMLVYLLEKKGKHYDYIWSCRKSKNAPSAAFLFNTDRICPDREFSCVLEVPGGESPLDALISSFRPITVSPQKAFTFILINIDLENIQNQEKEAAFSDLYEAARKRSGHGGFPEEDDIIILGTLCRTSGNLSAFQRIPNLVAVHLDKATRLDGSSTDNILFENNALSEYMERFGIADLSVFLKISPEQAKKISVHRPLWADFSLYEGGAGKDYSGISEQP